MMDSSLNKSHRKKTMFVDGPVSPDFIGNAVAKHTSDTRIGAHQIFLGQIRADEINGSTVAAIEFTAYRDMADEAYANFRETLFEKHELTCLHVYHSLGTVKTGQVNLFVFVSSAHRAPAIAACAELVEWIKKEAPVWGKEIMSDELAQWKINR